MRVPMMILGLAVLVVPAYAAECSFPVPEDADEATMLVNECGEAYETGYRIEGNTLYLPKGGKHRIDRTSEEEAEALLRETYGLVGEREALVRTRW